jgi:ribonuclease HI
MASRTPLLPLPLLFRGYGANAGTMRPTNQRAEILAIILALEVSLKRHTQLYSSPYTAIKIFSDSKYAVGCMTEWLSKWRNNGWMNAVKNPVANRDLIMRAAELQDKLSRLGKVKYRWIPRSENMLADRLCNKAMGRMVMMQELNKQVRLNKMDQKFGSPGFMSSAFLATTFVTSASDSAVDLDDSD